MTATLFDVLPPKRAATLEETAMSRQRALVLEALVDAQAKDPTGHHAFSLQTRMQERGIDGGIQRNAISSRLRELERDYGFVVHVDDAHAPSGKPEQVFAPTLDGVAWVAARRASQ